MTLSSVEMANLYDPNKSHFSDGRVWYRFFRKFEKVFRWRVTPYRVYTRNIRLFVQISNGVSFWSSVASADTRNLDRVSWRSSSKATHRSLNRTSMARYCWNLAGRTLYSCNFQRKAEFLKRRESSRSLSCLYVSRPRCRSGITRTYGLSGKKVSDIGTVNCILHRERLIFGFVLIPSFFYFASVGQNLLGWDHRCCNSASHF